MNYGYFDDPAREYVITRPDTPRAWSNYLGSRRYGAIITNNAGGYSFTRSPASGRFLRHRYNAVPMDMPGRQFYLRDKTSGDYWSAAWQPVVRANEFIERVKPWAVAKDGNRRKELGTALSALLETLRLTALLAWPVIPGKCDELWSMLRLPGKPGEPREVAARFGGGGTVTERLAEVKSLFPRLEAKTDARA